MSAPVRKSAPAVARTDGNLAMEPDWHQEVHSRLAAYRVRRCTLRNPDGQTSMPFSSVGAAAAEAEQEILAQPDREIDVAPVDWLPPSPAAQAPESRPNVNRYAGNNPRVEIAAEPPGLDWPRASRNGAAESHSTQLLRPVASLAERRLAAVLDAALLLFTFGGILALFCALGGRFTLNRLDAAVAVATLGLFYAQYFMLFTVFGGSTPGMMLRGLRVVSFDGDTPTPRQMLWRSFGYLISAGTLMLGYLWALWDEDHLCWQDRISQTYLTPMENPLGKSASSQASPALR